MNPVSPRKTFAIISHPDAGKTTLTERLLHAGGAIHLAGDVKGRGERRRTRSDWTESLLNYRPLSGSRITNRSLSL